MRTRKACWAAGLLLVMAAGQNGIGGGGGGSEGAASRNANVIVVNDCTVQFINKSTYATSRPGTIAELPYEEGDHVQPGDLVVRLRDEVAQATLRLREAQATMDTAILVAEKEQAAAELEYQSHLKANRISPTTVVQSEIDRLKLIAEARALQVQQAKEELDLNRIAKEQAEAELQSYHVQAKFGGLVTNVEKHIGEAVNLGDDIITIVDTSRVRVEGTLPYAQARRLKVGDPVRVQLLLPDSSGRRFDSLTSTDTQTPPRQRIPEEDEVFAGRIGFIDVETDSDLGFKNEIRVWAEVVNRDNVLLEGLPAVMKVQLLNQ